MDWKTRKRYTEAESDDGQIAYQICKNRKGRFYINASLVGGADYETPFQDFVTVGDAESWVESHEQQRAERNARRAQERPIRF